MTTKPAIWMLEDDADDRYLTTTTLEELGLEMEIIFLNESRELFALQEKGNRPALILLDYHSYPDSAIEILKRLKTDPGYSDVPVIILGENPPPKYIRECYLAGASSFIVKPSDVEGTRQKINIFFQYWLQTVALPLPTDEKITHTV